MHIVFQVTFRCSQVWLHSYECTYQYIVPKVRQPNSLKVRRILHGFAFDFTPAPEGEKFLRLRKIFPRDRNFKKRQCEATLMLKYITIQNFLNDFRIFIDTGYFSCVFGLIFVFGLLPLVSLGL